MSPARRERPRGRQGNEPLTLRNHPRAARSIRRAKAWCGLGAFVVMGLLSLRAGVPDFDSGVRALAAGLAGYVGAWALSLSVWRIVVDAEHRAAVRAAEAREAAATVHHEPLSLGFDES